MSEILTPRIAYFAGSMKPGHDGVTRVLFKMIELLNKHNISNIFFSPLVPPADEQTTEFYSVPSIVFPLYKDYRFAHIGYKNFEKRLNEFEPDIIHINSPCSLGYAAVKYANKYNIPVVATYHTHFPSYAKYYKIKTLEEFSWKYFRNIYNRCEKVYVPSEPILDELKNHGLETVTFLPHGVDTETFNPSFKSDVWKRSIGAEGKTIVLFAGRLVWEKDLKTLSHSYKIVSEKSNEIQLVIVGDGPVRKEIEALMPGAKFLGYKTGKELSTAFASSDIFVFPSTTETFGNVILEAMASGLPPICAREGGASGIVADKVTGMLTAPRDPAELADAILMLASDYEMRQRLAGNSLFFAQSQTWEKIFHQLLISYSEVISNHKLKVRYQQNTAA